MVDELESALENSIESAFFEDDLGISAPTEWFSKRTKVGMPFHEVISPFFPTV